MQPDYAPTLWVNAVSEFIAYTTFVFAHISFALMYLRISDRLSSGKPMDETDRVTSADRLSLNKKQANKAVVNRKHMI